MENKINNSIPGPNQYSEDNKILFLKNSPQVKIGKAIRLYKLSSLDSPSPASYLPKSSIGEGTKFTLKSRYPLLKQIVTPGPAQYNNKMDYLVCNPPSVKMTKSKRELILTKQDDISPGPALFNKSSELSKHGCRYDKKFYKNKKGIKKDRIYFSRAWAV